MRYFEPLLESFKQNADLEKAKWLKSYMREQFDFLGVASTLRNKLTNSFLRSYGLPENYNKALREMWDCKWREIQYAGIIILKKLSKKLTLDDIFLIEHLLTFKPWWDTVDLIAPNILPGLYEKYPAEFLTVLNRWINSDNKWLKRSSIIFQLRRKQNTDFELLQKIILALKDDEEFFIQSAIGWALREYGKFNLDKMLQFLDSQDFSNFVRRSALEYAKRKGLL